MDACIQTEWSPTPYQFPATSVAALAMPDPTPGVRAYLESLPERTIKLRSSELPSRAGFLRECVSADLVSEGSLQHLVESGSLVSLEMAIQEAILSFGTSFHIGKRPFTKTARSQLKLIGCGDSSLPDEITYLLARDAVTANMLEPNQVVSLLEKGSRAGSLMADAFAQSVRKDLPVGVSLHLEDNGMMLQADGGISLILNLPEDDSGASHALRIAVMNTLHAISMGIAFFNHPQLLFDPVFGVCYLLQEAWEYFKPLVKGKSLEEIEQLILEMDLETLEFELYFLGIEEPEELKSNDEALSMLTVLLHELDTFSRLYGIDVEAFHRDVPAFCTQQIDLMRGQAERYPEHAQVYQVMTEAMTSVMTHDATGKTYSKLSLHPTIVAGSENMEGGLTVMQGLFVLPSRRFSHVGDLVDEAINSDIDNTGFPAVGFEYQDGVVTHALKPMIEVIAEANALLRKIMSALQEAGYAGEEY